MAEIAGLAIGIVALLDTCVTTCTLISKANSFTNDLEFLRIGILWEESRLRDWASKWELGDEGGQSRATNLRSASLLIEEAKSMSVELSLIADTLRSTEVLLKRCQEMLTQYQSRHNSQGHSFKKVLKPVFSTKARVQWSMIDVTTFRALVTDLEKQNDRLHRLQPSANSTSREIQRITATSRTMVSIEQLGIQPDSQALDPYPEIKQLLFMRSEQSRTEAAGRNWIRAAELHVRQAEYKIQYDAKSASNTRAVGRFGDANDEVLIEWKYYVGSDSDSKDLTVTRTERIAELLAAKGKLPGFRILDCVGWFVEENKHRCGIMFSIPRPLPRANSDRSGSVHCLSLLDLIRAKTKPTLRDRFRIAYLLATSVMELHLAHWLHKSISSENVIFFATEGSSGADVIQSVNFTEPYFASFGLARPDHHQALSSIAMSANPVNKAYQHPDYAAKTVVSSSDTVHVPRYHRVYDVYSLGCVLLEVGLWTSLGDLGWDKWDQTNEHEKWRQALRDITTKYVAYHAGPIYHGIISTCLDIEVPADATGEQEGITGESSRQGLGLEIVRDLNSLLV
jgi:hypothetical protein